MGTEAKKGAEIHPELIPIREGEELDKDRLANFLRGKLEGEDESLWAQQFSGGHANLTYLLHYGQTEYVLRRPPMGPVAATAHDMGREYRVLSVLYKVFPPAPRAFLYCQDPYVIGAPFFIMERKRGTVVRNVVPPEFGSGQDPKKNRILSEVIIDALAELHGVDYRSVGLQDLGKPDGFMERQIRGWTGRYEKSMTKEIPIVKDVHDWLVDKLPENQVDALVHNDWRLDNMMLDPKDPAKVVGVFDWDMCTLGDPLADLGCLLSFWFEEGEAFGTMTAMPTQVPGFMTRRGAIERYGEKSGRDIRKMDFYYVFGLFKMAVVVQQIYFRYARGQTKDPRFQHFGIGAELLFSLAWSAAQASQV
jgi:aminoglycoside phosphotransferase (APT) family kinase protein